MCSKIISTNEAGGRELTVKYLHACQCKRPWSWKQAQQLHLRHCRLCRSRSNNTVWGYISRPMETELKWAKIIREMIQRSRDDIPILHYLADLIGPCTHDVMANISCSHSMFVPCKQRSVHWLRWWGTLSLSLSLHSRMIYVPWVALTFHLQCQGAQ